MILTELFFLNLEKLDIVFIKKQKSPPAPQIDFAKTNPSVC
jgi:hypothetical protein